ncbi:hypothetical protein NGM37_27255 [Streptomyces sp. TRM76130]|nr:hypothetical protein [Streptomyces sp. TRM76130]
MISAPAPIHTDAHRCRELGAVPARLRVDRVTGGGHGDARGEHHPVADDHLDVADQGE